MHHAHGILHGHRLPAACLIIGLGAPEAGKDERGPAVDHMTAVQVGGDMDGHVAIGERPPRQVGVGGGGGEVSAHAEEEARLTLRHRLDGVDHGITVLPGCGEPEVFLQGAEEGLGREFRDAHRPVTLDVAVPADRAGARSGTADVPPKQQEVDDFLNVGHAVPVLGESHRPAADHALRTDVCFRSLSDLPATQATLVEKILPRGRLHHGAECVETMCLLPDELAVQDAGS